MYKLDYTDQAKDGMHRLKREEPKAFLKLWKLLDELMEHPRTGTGKPEPLKGDRAGQWSRRITRKHRLIYEIHDTEVVVLVLTAYGHYDDR
jgi:toxin YoeB